MQSTEQKPPSFEDRFNKIATEKSSQEGNAEFYGRNLAQNYARTLETVAGLPGNYKKAAKQSMDYLQSFLPEDMRIQEPKGYTPEKGSIQDWIFNPSTSSELRENITKPIAEKVFGDKNYLEPRGEGEKFVGELNQDVTSFFTPGTGQMRLMTRIGAPIASNLAKQGAKYLGANEETAEQIKLGTMLAVTLANQSNPGQFASDRIGQAKNMIPESATVFAQPLANLLQPLVRRLQRGLRVPSKSRTMQGLEDLEAQIDGAGRLNMRSLMQARDDINEWISEAGGWDVPAPTRDAGIRHLNDLKRQIIDTIDQNMATRFPQAGELYRTGYEAAAVNHRSNVISNFIERYFGRKIASVGAKIAFPSLVGGAAILPKTVAPVVLGAPIYKTGQILYRIGNSPTLARYYAGVISASMGANVPAMIKSMEKFDKEMDKQEKKENKNKKTSLEEFKAGFKKND